jgi:hypothetical protein
MMDGEIERAIVVAAITLWFAYSWYLKRLRTELDRVIEDLDDLQEHVYETDPQFPSKRETLVESERSVGTPTDAGDAELLQESEQVKRQHTLDLRV